MDGGLRDQSGDGAEPRPQDRGLDRGYDPRGFDPRGYPAAAPQAADDGDAGMDIAKIFNVLWRGKWTILLLAALAVSAGHVWLKQQTPVYTASALVLVEGDRENVIDLNAVVAGVESNALASQAEIIRSDRMANTVIEKLRLDLDPEFNGAARGPEASQLRQLVRSIAPAFEATLLGAAPPERAPLDRSAAPDDATMRRVRNAFKGRISIVPEPRSGVMRILASSTDRRKAALIANTVADQYIVDQLEARFEGTQRATIWLSERLDDLRVRVEQAERAVEDHRATIAATSGQGVELTEQQLASLNQNLIEARAARAEAEARFDNVSRVAASGGNISSASGVAGAASVQSARLQLSDLRRQEAELATRYGPRHPRMINLRAEIDDVRRSISGEVNQVVATMRSELDVARAREQSLAESVAALEAQSLNQGQGMVRLRELEREADASRTIYQNFLERFKETSAQETLQETNARVIVEAQPPGGPTFPNTNRTLILALLIGVGAGVGLVFLTESMNNTFRDAGEFEAATGIAVLASVPRLGKKKKRRDFLEYIRSRPNSAFAESIRNLRTSVLLANIDKPPKSILVTSSVPSEGKSTVALMLAVMSASMGKRTILVECDLRRPTINQIYPTEHGRDVVAVLAGNCPLTDAVVSDEDDENFFVLPGMEAQANPADILSSQRFARLIESLEESFDMVVLDSPPVLAVTDARIVAKSADIAIMTYRWDETPRDLVKDAVGQMQAVGVRFAGCVKTLVDGKRQAAYKVGYGGYYTGKYADYYRH